MSHIIHFRRKNLPGFLWNTLLFGLMTACGLMVLQTIWGTLTPGYLAPGIAVLSAGLLCALANRVEAKPVLSWLLRLGPWLVLLLVFGLREIWQGLLLWLNCIISLRNQLHQGGVALFPAAATADSVRAFSATIAFALGQLIHWIVIHRHMIYGGILAGLLLLLQLLTGTVSPWACCLGLAGFLGLWITAGKAGPARQALRLWGMTAAILLLCSALLPERELTGVTDFRQNAANEIHTLRYGQEQLPCGQLGKAFMLNESTGEVMSVRTEQLKDLYLRAFVGAVYSEGAWTPLPDSAYSGDYAGMLNWLETQGFDPLTQPATYFALAGEEAPETNHMQVEVTGDSRDYLYIPSSTDAVTGTRVTDKKDTRLAPVGLFGADEYEISEVSPSWPSELTVRAQWVSQPQTEEQLQYTKAEAVYREFVYQNYTQVAPELETLLQQMFWEENTPENDGIYSAVAHVREVLSQRTEFAAQGETEQAEGSDLLRQFLAGGRGNAVLYATAAVQALRSHGIPTRYVEGYYLSSEAVVNNKGEAVSLTGQDAHAWAEIYFDGIGWLPVDVTPGYYFDAITLQMMVALPDTVKKTAELRDSSDGANNVTEDGKPPLTPLPEPEKVLKDTLMIFLGILAVLAILFTVLFLLLELMRWVVQKYASLVYRRADAAKRVQLLHRQLYHLLDLWGIDACLGWNTDETDTRLAEQFPGIVPGDYRRTAALLEKSIYGGIELEPFEMRTIQALLGKLYHAGLEQRRMRWRLRYSFLLSPGGTFARASAE